jgi:hypothetical protein
MATIDKRYMVNTTYRVRLRPEGLPRLYLTFSNKEDAEEWLEEHEQAYIDNPEPYQKWVKLNRKSVKENGIFHVHIPLENFH